VAYLYGHILVLYNYYSVPAVRWAFALDCQTCQTDSDLFVDVLFLDAPYCGAEVSGLAFLVPGSWFLSSGTYSREGLLKGKNKMTSVLFPGCPLSSGWLPWWEQRIGIADR